VNETLAINAWADTLKWRKDKDLAGWLSRPQPHFDVIKVYIHSFHFI
jgi:hypothetical protein